MLRKILNWLLGAVILGTMYLLLWPVPIDPVSWKAPADPGHAGVFARNNRLQALELLGIGQNTGPEATAVDRQGRVYAGTNEGFIIRLRADGTNPESWVNTGGRPLGMRFDAAGNLIVADAYRGLLSITPEGKLTELATDADGIPIRYADDVDIADDGKIYFSDATTKFSARQYGILAGSNLDIFEHGGHGRLLVYDPASRTTRTLLNGLNFANGVAVSHDNTFVLINETGSARTIRYFLSGSRAGTSEPFVEAWPGYPDNVSRGQDGRFWVALPVPRNAALEFASERPFLRKIFLRLPSFMIPMPAYGHIVALDKTGKVLVDLQDPSGKYPFNTSVVESGDYLYVGSLAAPALGRISKSRVGL